MRFSWDPIKARTNLRKHGISFDEATTVFADPLALLVEDITDAERSLITGESLFGRVLVTVFVDVGEDTLRIISARRATRQERNRYEEG